MRLMEFTTENLDAFKPDEELAVIESKLPSSYYYTIEHALGMSSNFANRERLKTVDGKAVGKVVETKKTSLFNIVVLGFEQ